MPPAIIAAGVGAAGAIGGGIAQSRAAGHAADAQERSTQAAIDLEKERDAQRAAQWEAEQRNLAPFRQARLNVLKELGYVPRNQTLPTETAPPPGWQPGQAQQGPRTLGDIAGLSGMGQHPQSEPMPMAPQAPVQAQGVTLGDLAGFSDLLGRYRGQ